MKEHSWQKLVEIYTVHEAKYCDPIPLPATNEELLAMTSSAAAEGIIVDHDYVEFLKTRNGTSFNGLMLYGANIPEHDSCARLDLVVMNQYHWNRGDTTVLGSSDIDLYVIAGPNGPFQRLDRASWDVVDEFISCEALLLSIFSEQVKVFEHADKN